MNPLRFPEVVPKNKRKENPKQVIKAHNQTCLPLAQVHTPEPPLVFSFSFSLHEGRLGMHGTRVSSLRTMLYTEFW